MIVIAKRDEAEGLQGSFAGSPNWGEHFGHASNRATLQMKGNFDEIALGQRPGEAQQAASNGNGLKFSFGALTVFQHDECGNGTTNLNTRRAALRVHLGEVSHDHPLSHGPLAADRLRKAQARSKNQQSIKSLPIKRMGLSAVFRSARSALAGRFRRAGCRVADPSTPLRDNLAATLMSCKRRSAYVHR